VIIAIFKSPHLTEKQNGDVCEREADEVQIGGGVHVRLAEYDQTDEDVAREACAGDERVESGNGQQHLWGQRLHAESRLQKLPQGEVGGHPEAEMLRRHARDTH